MLTISNTVATTLQGFFEAFAKEGIAKVPNEDVCAATEQIPSLRDWQKYLYSQVNVSIIILKSLLGALSTYSTRLVHVCYLLSTWDSFEHLQTSMILHVLMVSRSCARRPMVYLML
jgi:hypothetical protein